MEPKFHFRDSRITLFILCTRVRRFGFKMASQVHDLVSNDPILDSKVVPDELGQLGRPAERAGRAWPARAGQPGGRASPAGRPGRLAGRWAASREGNEGRAQEGAQRAGADGAPPLLSPQVGYLVRFLLMHEESIEGLIRGHGVPKGTASESMRA